MPVAVSRGMAQITKILVPIDFSEGSRAAMEHAVMLAKKFDATVDLLHAWETPIFAGAGVMDAGTAVFPAQFAEEIQRTAKENLAKWKTDLQREIPAAKAFLVMSDPATAAVDKAKEYDLIVTGTHGRTGVSRWAMGSVAEKIVRHAPCAVLTVRAPKSEAGRA
jgi:universal stress protein A